MISIELKPGILKRLAWGRPDSPQRDLCALCHGSLPEVPLMMWRSDGAAVKLCDACVPLCITAHKTPE